MSSSVFPDKSSPPDDRKLAEALGSSHKLWAEIKDYLSSAYGDVTEEWKYYGPKSGWILKSFRKKRNLFFLTPGDQSFRVAFVFGDKAVAVIHKSDLPKTLIEGVTNARKYAEGRGLRIDVRTQADVAYVKTLIAIKTEN